MATSRAPASSSSSWQEFAQTDPEQDSEEEESEESEEEYDVWWAVFNSNFRLSLHAKIEDRLERVQHVKTGDYFWMHPMDFNMRINTLDIKHVPLEELWPGMPDRHDIRNARCHDFPPAPLHRPEFGLVFRALDIDENPANGLEGKFRHEKFPNAILAWNMKPTEHVQDGSSFKYTPFISTSWCPIAALFYAVQNYSARHDDPEKLKLVAINLNPRDVQGSVLEHAFIIDVSKGVGMDTPKAYNYATEFEEVLLKGVVPPNSIVGDVSLDAIPRMANDPWLLPMLRMGMYSGVDHFREVCAGALENCLRRHFGLPVWSSVQPERALRSMRVIRAKKSHQCNVCTGWVKKGQLISMSLRGFAHKKCCVKDYDSIFKRSSVPAEYAPEKPRIDKALREHPCPLCKGLVERGQNIAKYDDGYAHAECLGLDGPARNRTRRGGRDKGRDRMNFPDTEYPDTEYSWPSYEYSPDNEYPDTQYSWPTYEYFPDNEYPDTQPPWPRYEYFPDNEYPDTEYSWPSYE